MDKHTDRLESITKYSVHLNLPSSVYFLPDGPEKARESPWNGRSVFPYWDSVWRQNGDLADKRFQRVYLFWPFADKTADLLTDGRRPFLPGFSCPRLCYFHSFLPPALWRYLLTTPNDELQKAKLKNVKKHLQFLKNHSVRCKNGSRVKIFTTNISVKNTKGAIQQLTVRFENVYFLF